jgi:hypothetical protein
MRRFSRQEFDALPISWSQFLAPRMSKAKCGISDLTQPPDIATFVRLRFEICTAAKHVHILVAVQQKMH